MISLSLSRTGLSLPALVADTPGSAWIPEDGLGDPGYRYRITYAPPSDHIDGGEKYAAALEMGELPVTIYLQAATTTALRTKKTDWVNAFGQWSYQMTVTIDGASDTYLCDPVYPRWNDFDSGMTRAFLARAVVPVPVQPLTVTP